MVWLFLSACADPASEAQVNGSVNGDSFAGSSQGIVVHRLADTQLSPGDPTLDFYFAEGGLLDACPDIGEPGDESVLTFSLRAHTLKPGSYDFCDGFECADFYVDTLGKGWQTPIGDVIRITGGYVQLDTFDDERAAGSFHLEFEHDEVSGRFDLPVACADSRPGQP